MLSAQSIRGMNSRQLREVLRDVEIRICKNSHKMRNTPSGTDAFATASRSRDELLALRSAVDDELSQWDDE